MNPCIISNYPRGEDPSEFSEKQLLERHRLKNLVWILCVICIVVSIGTIDYLLAADKPRSIGAGLLSIGVSVWGGLFAWTLSYLASVAKANKWSVPENALMFMSLISTGVPLLGIFASIFIQRRLAQEKPKLDPPMIGEPAVFRKIDDNTEPLRQGGV